MAKESKENTNGALTLNNSPQSNVSAPLCRCRVLYIGSAVPTVSKDGLQGIQQPLKERYPANENAETKGIDSWLSVWSNGLLLEYVDGTKRTENAFFPVVTLHYCAAVRYVNASGFSIEGGGERFIPLDTPFAHIPKSPHPPIFAAIFRRTSGIKVLECHAFICTNENSANALVRCCFHSYANTIYLKIDEKMGGSNVGLKAIKESSSRSVTPISEANLSEQENNVAIDDIREESNWNERAIGQKTWQRRQQNGEYDSTSISSIMYNNRKSNNEKKRQSSLYDNRAVAPYIENRYTNTIRRGGSQPDVRDYCDANYNHYDRATLKEFKLNNFIPPSPPEAMRPLQGFMPRMMFGGYGYPPFMMPPISQTMPPISKKKSSKRSKSSKRMPPFFMPRSFAPPPPPAYLLTPPMYHGLPPIGRPGSCRPHMMPPRFYFPPPHNLPFQFAMMERARNTGTFVSPDAGSGPIITESIYDTFPRNRISQGTYEEPIYMPSNYGYHQDPTLSSSYKPENISPENYETFYETYRLRKKNNKKHGSGSDSDASEDGSNSNTDNDRACNFNHSNHRFWEAYEASVYRKTHINEKAFANSVIEAKSDQNNNNNNSNIKFDVETMDKTQPHIPPADYDCDNSTQTPVRRSKAVSQDCRVPAY